MFRAPITKLTAIAFCLFSVPLSASAQQSYFGRSVDPGPVELSIQDKDEILYFSIPKAYLTFSKNWLGGLQDGFVLETVFPSMVPRSLARVESNNTDALVINLYSFAYTGANQSTRKTIDFFIKDRWALVESALVKNSGTYQYYVEKSDVEKRHDSARLIKEFYVVSGQDIYFECFRELSNPHVGCHGVADYGKNLSLSFAFRRSQFERWPEFYDAVVRLLNSLRKTI
jgi:hypothetical protein